MPDDHPNDNPKTVWQNQPTEAPTMTLETIRLKVSESRSKRRRALLGSIATVLIVVAISVFGIKHGSSTGTRILFAIAVAWILAGQSFLHRGMWLASLPANATLSTGLEFYRREVEGQQEVVRRVLQWSFGPVILSIGTLIAVLVEMAKGQGLPVRAVMPFATLIGIWIVAFFVLRSREQRKLRLEIDALSDEEKAIKR